MLLSDDWQKAQEWLVVNSNYIFANQSKTAFCVPSTPYLAKKNSIDYMKQQLRKWHQKVEPIGGEDFDAYTTRRGSSYQVEGIRPTSILSPVLVLSCSCVFYNKYAKCKHALVVAIHTQMIPIPSNCSIQVIGTSDKKKRGRKALAPTQSQFHRAQKP
jgi:hypothetical protein